MKELDELFVDHVQILEFLSIFFASELVAFVCSNLHALSKSKLGIGYTLEWSKANISKAIIEGLQEVALGKGHL